MTLAEVTSELRITVEYTDGGHGRYNKVFHVIMPDGLEIILSQKQILKLARDIQKIAGEGK